MNFCKCPFAQTSSVMINLLYLKQMTTNLLESDGCEICYFINYMESNTYNFDLKIFVKLRAVLKAADGNLQAIRQVT